VNAGRVGCVLLPGASPEFTFVVAPGFLAAVPITTPSRSVEALRALSERALSAGVPSAEVPSAEVPSAGVPSAEVLSDGVPSAGPSLQDLLSVDGADALASVVVVQMKPAVDDDGLPVSVLVRGPIVVDVFSVGGSRRIFQHTAGSDVHADLRAVTGLVIGSAARPRVDPRDLASGQAVGRGAISGNAVFWSAAEREIRTGPALTGSPRTGPPLTGPVRTDALPIGTERTAPVSESGEPVIAADFGDTVLRAPAESGGTGSPGVPAVPQVEDTILRRPAGTPNVAPEHSIPDIPVPEPYGFRLRDGSERRLDTAYVLGRHPKPLPGAVGAARSAQMLQVPSATSAVSATHLEIRQDGDAVVVTDVGSTNGTIVIPARGRRQRLRAGQSLSVRPGTRVDIGDGNIIEVLR